MRDRRIHDNAELSRPVGEPATLLLPARRCIPVVLKLQGTQRRQRDSDLDDRERLLDEVRPGAFAIAYRILGSVLDAEDVVQERCGASIDA
jgi:hypothetical protein